MQDPPDAVAKVVLHDAADHVRSDVVPGVSHVRDVVDRRAACIPAKRDSESCMCKEAGARGACVIAHDAHQVRLALPLVVLNSCSCDPRLLCSINGV